MIRRTRLPVAERPADAKREPRACRSRSSTPYTDIPPTRAMPTISGMLDGKEIRTVTGSSGRPIGGFRKGALRHTVIITFWHRQSATAVQAVPTEDMARSPTTRRRTTPRRCGLSNHLDCSAAGAAMHPNTCFADLTAFHGSVSAAQHLLRRAPASVASPTTIASSAGAACPTPIASLDSFRSTLLDNHRIEAFLIERLRRSSSGIEAVETQVQLARQSRTTETPWNTRLRIDRCRQHPSA